ncbi:phosphoribosyltransferase, partial [Bacteroides acidifaciens]|uniref:phosphoribosyltransferase n=1 Tax=Bacteroides acidifaciens TaxID=85831 RepID=UPI002149C3EC|nr:phosphoribosyltransferase [Bacteroides acidifaciens]
MQRRKKSAVDGLNPKLFSVTYLNERDSKHLSTDRDNITASSNIVVNSDIIGKKAILVDDAITTGNSLREHIEELRMFNVEIIGAVFLAKTIQYPSSLCNHSIFRHDNFIGCFSADKIKMPARKYFCFNIPVYKNMVEES